jgi:acyl carrier protein
MENMNVRQEIKQFIAENFLFTGDINKINDDASFMDEGIIDSMGIMELIVFIEETYKINVKDDEIEPDNLDSVNNLYNFIMRKTESTQVAA